MRRPARSRSRHRNRDVPNPVGVSTLTVADPDFVGSAVAVAVTFTPAGFGTTAGVVPSPHESPVVLGSHSRKAKVEETENCRQRERIGPNSRQSLAQVRSSGLPFTGCRIRAILRVIHSIHSKGKCAQMEMLRRQTSIPFLTLRVTSRLAITITHSMRTLAAQLHTISN